MTFREYINQQNTHMTPASHKWKAKKDEIIPFWKTLQPNTPILVKPIEYLHTGTTYGQDGVRITGSKEFITSVLARLKEFIQFEGPTTKLQLVYRETDAPNPQNANRTSFVFYIQVKNRGQNQ